MPVVPFLYAVLPGLAGAAILVGVQRHQPVQARAWRWLAFGLGLIALGHVLSLTPPIAGVHLGVLTTAAGYACLVSGAFLFSRSTGLRDDIAILDAAIIGLALATIVWGLFIEPVAAGRSTVGPVLTVLAVGYPVIDVLVVAILMPLVIVDPVRRVSSCALVASFGLFAFADGQGGADLVRGVTEPSELARLAGVVASLLIMAVAVHRRTIDLGSTQHAPSPSRDLLRTIGVSSSVLVPPVALLFSVDVDVDGDRFLETAVAVLIALLVVIRLHRTVSSLVQAQIQFRQLTAYPGLLAVIKDARGRYRFMSDKAVANNGLEGMAWYGKTDAELFDAPTATFRTSLDVEARRTGDIQVRTYEVGDSTWHTEKFLLHDLPGWIGVIGVDITDRVRADAHRRALEAELAAVDAAVAKDSQRRSAERALIRDALRSAEPGAAPEATAEVICRALAAVPDFSHGTIVAFDAAGEGRILSFVTHLGESVASRQLSAARSAYLRERAYRGPWVERWLADREHPYQDVIDALAIAGHAYAPIVADDKLIGLLIAGSSDPGALVRLTEWLPGLAEFAEISAALLAPGLAARHSHDEAVAAMTRVLETAAFRPVFQPIVDLRSGATLGYEALTRFADGTPPDVAFAAARRLGLGDHLEHAAVRAALDAAVDLPAEAWLNVNASPSIVECPDFATLIGSAGREIVVEITEHDEIADYAAFRAAFARLDGRARLCIDDAGAGFASLRHVVELGPAFVKLDRSLVAGIHRDPARQAAVAGLVHYARVAGVRLVAEGIEEPGELEVLKGLGVVLGQGYLLGRPAPIARSVPVPMRAATRRRSRVAA